MKVVILRGIPGSGKSTYAQKLRLELTEGYLSAPIVSADAYFTAADGMYRFDPKKIGMAHINCFTDFLNFLDPVDDWSVNVIVDNTNVRLWEASPYVLAAKAHDFDVEVIRFECDPEVAAARCVHGVPAEKIRQMAARMEKGLPDWNEKVVQSFTG